MALFLRPPLLRRSSRSVTMQKVLRRKLSGGTFTHVPEARARRMKAVRGSGNRTTEIRLKMALVRAGISGWTLHPKAVPGSPDLFFKAVHLVVFVDGCFWHGCIRCGHIPDTNRAYWKTKIMLNRARDKRITKVLRANGFKVLRFWEHELATHTQQCVLRIRSLLDRATGSR